jgi:hypothetical protein
VGMQGMTRVSRSAIARRISSALLLLGSLSCEEPAQAVEYGLGDYLLGFSIPMSGYTPPPGFYFQDTFYLYNGSASANVNFQFGNLTSVGIDLKFAVNIASVAWYTDATILGGSLGFAALLPIAGERTSAAVSFTGPLGINRRFGRSDDINALGDSAYSAILGWHAGEHHWNVSLTGFVPTGYNSPDALAITGLNRPGIDIKAAYTFLSQTGIEVTIAPGVTVNAINNKTNYQSGAEFHVEWAVNQHLPIGLYAGVGGYFYQQFTNDGGAGNRIGPFKGRVASVGPMAGYTFKVGDQEVNIAGRWFHEFAVKNRVRGESIFASLSFRL